MLMSRDVVVVRRKKEAKRFSNLYIKVSSRVDLSDSLPDSLLYRITA
jgi:hypothetical protein